MNHQSITLAAVLGCAFFSQIGFGQTEKPSLFPDRISFRADNQELIQPSNENNALVTNENLPTSGGSVSDEVTALPSYTVVEERFPDLIPPRENVVQKFFRTGTIAQHVGKKVTTRFWAEGDKGLMLSFYH